ncbi:MAG: ribonuclease D [Gemmatimonadota bacterium]|nr:MAG: ribonuclease D [Gemmatimonadota bacterium]
MLAGGRTRLGTEPTRSPEGSIEHLKVRLVADDEAGLALAEELRAELRIAIDLEAAGFHRYSDEVRLVQLSSPDRTYVIDPMAFDLSGVLRPALENPEVQVLIHGGDYDVRLLDRDLDIHPTNLFDTQVAASLTGEPSVGLAALLEKYCSVSLSKKHQRADWAKRPLPDELIEYAAADTRYLHALADVLEANLEEMGRTSWAEEEFAALETVRWSDDPETDPVAKVKGARSLPPRKLQALREALAWRDEIAQRRDRAPFRVVGDPALMTIVAEDPSSVAELGNVKGLNPRLVEQQGGRLLARLRTVRGLPEDQIPPYPRPKERGPSRPTPEEEQWASKIKKVRVTRAEELGIDRGLLLPNAVIYDLARRAPVDAAGLNVTEGLRNWQIEAVGDAVLAVMNC